MDSLLQLIKTLPDSSGQKAKAYNDMAWEVGYVNLDSSIYYAEKGKELAIKYGHGRHHAQSWNVLGTIYNDKGDYNKAIACHLKAIELREQLGIETDLANSYHNMALVYSNMDSLSTALMWQRKTYSIYLKHAKYYTLAMTCNNLGATFSGMKMYDSAIVYYQQGITYSIQASRNLTLAMNHAGLGFCFATQKNISKANFHAQEGLRIVRDMQSPYELMGAFETTALTYELLTEYDRSLMYLDSALILAEQLGVLSSVMKNRQARAEILFKSGKHKEALLEYDRYEEIKDTLLSVEKNKSIRATEERYKKEKNEKELAILEKQNARQSWLVSVVLFSIVGLIVLVALLYGRINLGKKSEALLRQTQLVIEEKNKNITDSILYARKIQEAVMPDKSQLQRHFQDSFIINRPKDIVGGDFWWIQERGDVVWICVADCTGHGVPGAFMSVMCSTFLNETVVTHPDATPDMIFNSLREKITATLSRTKSQGTLDSMDAVLLRIDTKRRTLQSAGANNPIWIVRNGGLITINADKQPVGKWGDVATPFTLQEYALESGDMFYIGSDGYADQFGGAAGGKKFKSSRLKEELTRISTMSCTEQESWLNNTFDTWKGTLEQVDDVLMIGLRVK
jgi:serine phosphatase RsbU (regulator of sigma subunit)